MSRVVLVGADALLEHQARILLGDEVVSLAPASSDVLATRLLWLDRRPELVLFGAAMPTRLSLSLAAALRDLVDVLALQSDDPDLAAEARAAGITEFLGYDPELEDLDALVAAARERVARVRGVADTRRPGVARMPGRVVVVASPKGGVGKSTVAVNLAVALAEDEPAEVVLVDLDLPFGDVATLVGVPVRHSVVDATGKAAARDDFVLGTFLHEHPDGFFVLPAPVNPAAGERVDPRRIGHLLRQLAARFRHVVVDTSPGAGDLVLAALEQASAVVLVAGADVASARGLRAFREALGELSLLPEATQVVLNDVPMRQGLTATDAATVIGAPIDVVVPRRPAVLRSGNLGIPVLLSTPRDAAARALRELARRVERAPDHRDRRGERPAPTRRRAS